MALLLPLQFEFGRNIRTGVVERAMGARGVHLVDFDPWVLKDVGERMSFDGFDGAILWEREGNPLVGYLERAGIPVVYCGLDFGDIAGLPAVAVDRGSINRLAIRHFREIGLKDFALLRSTLHSDEQRERKSLELKEQVLREGMRWHSYVCRSALDPLRPAFLWEGHRDADLREFFLNLPKPCGLLAADDHLAIMAAWTALHHGFRVPEDIAILGQGDRVEALTSDPSISSIPFPGREVGRLALDLLTAFAGRKPDKSLHLVPCAEVVIRESTCGRSHDLAMERARRYMEQNVLAGVRLKELAAIAECSPNTFVARFRETHGSDPVSWLREKRLAEACRLMKETDLTLGEISHRCGFGSPSNFVNFFRRQTGKNPGNWRGAL